MSQFVQQEALTRLLMERGVFTREEFLEMEGSLIKRRIEKEIGKSISGSHW
jgi:hypothetical protein